MKKAYVKPQIETDMLEQTSLQCNYWRRVQEDEAFTQAEGCEDYQWIKNNSFEVDMQGCTEIVTGEWVLHS